MGSFHEARQASQLREGRRRGLATGQLDLDGRRLMSGGRLQGLRAVTSGRVQAEVVWTGHQ
jgi:hypothetical protein